MSQKWEPLAGVSALFYRDYGQDGKTWMFRQMVNGTRITDYLGAMSQERAIVVVSQLRENRKLGAGPQTWAEMEGVAQEEAKADKIKEEQERKRLLAADEFTRSNTIENYWINVYWPERQKDGSAHNNKSISGIFENWIRPVVGNIPLQELTYIDVNKMLDRAREEGLSQKTQRNIYVTLQALWNDAKMYHSVKRNMELPMFPGKGVKKDRLRINNKKTCFLDTEEAKLMLETLRNWREFYKQHKMAIKGQSANDAYGMAVVALFSGLRFGDIASLTWGEVANKEQAYARNPKGGRAYGIHLNISIIREMLAERKKRLHEEPKPDELVFKNARGEKWVSVPQIYKTVIQKLGFNEVPRRYKNPAQKIDFHALRHTFASWLAMQSVSLYTIMKLMGHQSLAMTERYADLDPTLTKACVEKMYWNFSDLTEKEGDE
ncbi:tyrosine-type recombinase/integrase [Desulfovibrio aerotolerans]|uniref:Tyrosine-type recombinase/integrase n=1 Tax=Solidesulfovibrio aerotolerans TaxID=295255 RepID=A0A7C9IR60_9BACT|nr:site-specific integrase [Solidesulfovibrio aerotolerans]MYL81807.1 tyrosine-type recombinase/integrase [Solidesulfovibrio aerotolerans]